jgi:hypothetical protein
MSMQAVGRPDDINLRDPKLAAKEVEKAGVSAPLGRHKWASSSTGWGRAHASLLRVEGPGSPVSILA